jgi:hypothetical protein
MAITLKDTTSKVKSNLVGAIIGAGAGFLIAQKVVKTEKTWLLIAISVVGGVGGAMVQSNMKAKASQPTAQTVKK